MSEEAEVTKKVEPIWKCKVTDCTFTTLPTLKGYQRQTGHQKAHKGVKKLKRGFSLIDKGTGEVLAQNIEEATAKGYPMEDPSPLPPPPESSTKATPEAEVKAEAEVEVQPEAKPEEAAEVKAEAEVEVQPEVKPEEAAEVKAKAKAEKEPEITIPQPTSEGILRYTISLPADAFTLFNLAKFTGLEDGDKLFDEWIWECITARYRTDYKMRLVLAPEPPEED